MVERRPSVFFTTPVLHHPPTGGPFLRIENSLKALARVSDLFLYSRADLSKMGGRAALRFYEGLAREVILLPRQSWHAFKRKTNALTRKLTGRDWFIPTFDSERTFEHLLQTADRLRPDLIWLGYGNISYPLLDFLRSRSPYKVVLDTDSVWSRFVLRGIPYARDEVERREREESGKRKEAEEQRGCCRADVTTAVSEEDAEYYRTLVDDPAKVHVFPNVVDLADYVDKPPPPAGFRRPCLCLMGTFGPRSPMQDAARWFIEEILPAVHRRVPDVRLHVVGSGSRETLANVRDPRVVVSGWVPSTLPFLGNADVAVVPLRFESGTRFKILEAGACGVPVVSTSLGAEGLEVKDGKDLLLADGASEFAAAIVRLLGDPRLAGDLATCLRQTVASRYDVGSLAEQARRILAYLAGG